MNDIVKQPLLSPPLLSPPLLELWCSALAEVEAGGEVGEGGEGGGDFWDDLPEPAPGDLCSLIRRADRRTASDDRKRAVLRILGYLVEDGADCREDLHCLICLHLAGNNAMRYEATMAAWQGDMIESLGALEEALIQEQDSVLSALMQRVVRVLRFLSQDPPNYHGALVSSRGVR